MPSNYKQLVLLYLFVWLVTTLTVVVMTYAHDAPTGWTYGSECCSLMDCFQERVDNVQETSQGYVVVDTHEVIPYGDERIKHSKDEFYHRCARMGVKTNMSICLYVPNKGF